jgi:hypothetical protein
MSTARKPTPARGYRKGRTRAPRQRRLAGCEELCEHHHAVRESWARQIKRVLELDLDHCRNCGGGLEIIAAILEQPVIEKIRTHLGLQALRERQLRGDESGQSMSRRGRK